MAEILLARLVGPSGFERPVVIKRIRPDLDHAELVSLFLEEARLAAKVRHANVVAVEDLGSDDGAPYLVMEYLEGESLSNVTRRMKARGENLPYGLVAYVLAEACAGLHAAHELRDGNGEPVGLVHRDVSPQNVFVTYDGAIKVVDFGIAKTGASAEESPGTVRGKHAYMAPEQIRGEPADRRTDVFALGIVLYEQLTGHRLFKRFNPAAVARAVLTDPIVMPSRAEPSVPKTLEAICMRALSRAPDQRYATAAEMRRELLVAMRELASEEPSAELAQLMVEVFSDRISDKRVLLRNVREGSVVDHIPVGDVDVTIEIPGIEDLPVESDWATEGGTLPWLDSTAPLSVPAPAVIHTTAKETPPSIATTTTITSLEVAAPPPPRRWPLAAASLFAVAGVALVGVGAARMLAQKRALTTLPPPPPAVAPSFDAAPASASAIAIATAERPITAAAPTTAAPPPAPPSAVIRRARALPVATVASPAPPNATPAPETGLATPPAPSASARGFRRFQ
jgi:serine/threonine-protein kinase